MLLPLDWLEERTGLVGGVKYFLFRNVPRDINWMQTLGAATLTAFLVQATTGVFLAMYYKPDPENAYASIQNITHEVTLGWLVRGMHKWGASVFIILMFLHMGRVFLFGAYKYPRELNWIVGVLLLVLGMLEGFTGLPAAMGPDGLLGHRRRHQPERDRAVRGAVPRGLLTGREPDRARHDRPLLLAAHAAHPRRDHRPDRAAPLSRRAARRHLAAVVEDGRRAAAGGARAARPGRASSAPRRPTRSRARWRARRSEERREQFARYKEDVKKEGKPFFPYAMWHDTIMALVVVVRDHRARLHLVLHRQARARRRRDPRAARHGQGRPGHDELRAAAGLVLLLPLLPAADLQVARLRLPRHGRRADDPPRPADRRSPSTTAARSGGCCGGRSRSSPRCSSSSRWRR